MPVVYWQLVSRSSCGTHTSPAAALRPDHIKRCDTRRLGPSFKPSDSYGIATSRWGNLENFSRSTDGCARVRRVDVLKFQMIGGRLRWSRYPSTCSERHIVGRMQCNDLTRQSRIHPDNLLDINYGITLYGTQRSMLWVRGYDPLCWYLDQSP